MNLFQDTVKVMKKISLLACILCILCGCFIYKPKDNVAFNHVEQSKQLEGVYSNLGEGGSGPNSMFLSRIIWPDNPSINYGDVLTIEVRATNDKTLVVTAHGKNGILHKSIFVEGKDFELRAGRIRLKQKISIAGFKSGEPMVGPYYEYAELGIDQKGSGKYRTQAGAVGLAYLFLPIAIGVSEEVRFEKRLIHSVFYHVKK